MYKRPILLPLIFLIVIILVADAFFPTIFIGDHYTKHLDNSICFKYLITGSPKETPKTYSYTAKITAYYNSTENKWEKTKGKIKIYIPKNKKTLLKYGDEIICNDHLQVITNFDSSSAFNYARFMRHQRIYHRVFVKNFTIIESNKGNKIINTAKQINTLLKDRIHNTKMGKEQKNLAVALLLGDKKDLDKDIRQQFNTSGLAHILCVSGLHIMLIVSAFSFILKFILPQNISGLFIRNIINILLCWTMAFIVGLTPSALRVAVMMSLLIIAKFTPLNNDKINVLFVCAFIFLCFDPMILFNISFELSFLAMLGILLFTRKSYNYIRIKFKIQNSFCKRILFNSVNTLSAQIFTLPIIAVNFSRIPVFFLITNIIVIPFIQIILVSLILLLALSGIQCFNTVMSFLCNIEMSFLMAVAEVFDKITSLVI